MQTPKVNDGIHGTYADPDVVKEMRTAIENFKNYFPATDVQVYLASREDKRWDHKREGNGNGHNNGCEKCDISIAGYKTDALCEGCKKD